MGLIRMAQSVVGAVVQSATGVISDQWKEYFYCDAMPSDVLVKRGIRKSSGNFNRGSDNIITNGSGIAVADGQCMIIVDQGKIVEVCAEAGEFTYDASSEPSIFTGNLGSALYQTFELIGKRFTYGADPGKDQRVYYFNTKEIMDNKFGTPNPIPFRVVDSKIGLDRDVDIRCSGVYSFRIADPLLFYTNVCGNVERDYTIDNIETQLKTEFVNALAPALGKLVNLELRPSQLTAHYTEITEAMNEQLTREWGQKRGLEVVSIALNPIVLSEEDSERIKAAQDAAVYSNPAMAAATISQATAEAMKDAAKNEAGAMNGFIGMGMAMNNGGATAAGLFQQAAQQQGAQMAQVEPGPVNNPQFQETVTPAEEKTAEEPAATEANYWTCPECGAVNDNNFCVNCGTKRPLLIKKCLDCGFTPADQNNLPNFCPQCGRKFGE